MTREQLVEKFQMAEDRIKREIARVKTLSDGRQRKQLLLILKNQLEALQAETNKWLKTQVIDEFIAGTKIVDDAIRLKSPEIKIDGTVGVNKTIINALITENAGKFNDAINYANKAINDMITDARREFTVLNVTTNINRPKMAQVIRAKLVDNGVKAIETSNGRRLNLTSYAKMATQTTLKIALNRGIIEQCKVRNIDLIRMSEHFPTCAICMPLQGRVYSISGNDKDFPPLSKALDGPWETIHPNCKHSFTPYLREWQTDERNQEMIEKSKRPFELNQYEQDQLKRYNDIQKRKAIARNNRKEYEDMKIQLGNEMPSYQGFIRSKNSNGMVYNGLREKINDIKSKVGGNKL